MNMMLNICIILGLLLPISGSKSRHWRCDNGQRIEWARTCDGKIDCVDHSDETTSECRSIVFEPGEITENKNVDRKMSLESKVDNAQIPETDSCRITAIPENGFIFNASDPREHLKINEMVGNAIQIKFGCIDNHSIVGNHSNLCWSGHWVNELPICQPFCSPSKLASITFQPSCRLGGEVLRCTDPAKPNAIATISCKQGYESQRAEQVIRCGSDGQWYPEPSACTQICGEIVREGTPFIIGGENANISEFPWHVHIYKRIYGNFEQFCSGTILNARVVISAMRCFWDEKNGAPFDKSLFRIKAGKTYRDYNSDIMELTKVQDFSIEKVIQFDAFSGANTSYLGDIAILLLDNYIEFKFYIAPVCMDYELQYDDNEVPANRRGVLAGWVTETSISDSLQETIKRITLAVVDRQECQRVTPFVSADKFCAGDLYYNGVCSRDRGAGLVFNKDIGENTKFFLRGIVSANGQCGGKGSYTTFTNTALYSDFISKYEKELRPTAISIGCPTLSATRNGHITYYGNDEFLLNPKNDSEYYDSRTKAEINCLTGYEISGASQQNLTCDESGIWTPLLEDFTCIPICGKEASTGSAYIVGGNETDIHKVSWHVGIYKTDGPKINYKCGGTILSEAIVISAMHSFWDRSNEKAYEPSLFKVAAGKEFIDYHSTQEPYLVQYVDVLDLKYYEDYRDLHGNFASDIVLVMLNGNINFRQHIAPICLQLDQVTFVDVSVKDGLVGTLAGWGLTKTHGQPSQRLKIVDLPAVNKDKCITDSGYVFQDFLTLDKFCAGHLNADISACKGDSGGGLVFPQTINGRRKYFLRGIVSVGANYLNSCDSSKYTAFTNVIFHDKFVRSVLFSQ